MQQVSSKEKWSFGLGAFGQNMVFGLITFLLLVFYTDVLEVSAAFVGTLFLLVRIWDAVLDPVIAVVIDRVHTRWGRFRPFVLAGGILVSILTVLCFYAPDLSPEMKTVYLVVTYALWNTAYALFDVPYWSMAPAMTIDPVERTKVIAIGKMLGILGAVIASGASLPIVNAIGNGNAAKGYFWVAVIFGSICVLSSINLFRNTKEHHYEVKQEKESLKASLDVVLKNKPLLILTIASLFSGTTMVLKQTVTVYYIRYNLGNEGLFAAFSLSGMLLMLLAAGLMPKISAKLGKKNTYIAGGIIGIIGNILFYFGQPDQIVYLFVMNAVSMFSIGFSLVLTASMQADTIEYAQWKTGKRSESIITAVGTFAGKISTAIAGAAAGFGLTFFGYAPNVIQSAVTLNGINLMMSIFPVIGIAISVIIICFYDLTENKYAEIVENLNVK
ncbi:MFS transporter [Paenibacillus sp. D2_2]|uniref:MFS transporter n=1 Tax=Paenibacillus sp. D2_2 TaxID=3073092 RepID=UPI002816418D|nr:MFS transporter [Paenibacillus sp. D2_2]WMT43239.1 MFS transporter [Paenibacillus sp. D2_2]